MTDLVVAAERLLVAYSELSKSQFRPGATYLAEALEDRRGAYSAIGRDGDFALLLPLNDAVGLAFEETMDSISISYNVALSVDVRGAAVEQSAFAVVSLHHDKMSLLSGFAFLSAALLQALPAEMRVNDVRIFLEDFRLLFVPKKHVSRDVIKGLWGELWIMSQVANPCDWVHAWHVESSETFDFSFPSRMVEVKSTETEIRQHHFSLNQLQSYGKEVVVASLKMQADASGASLASLLDSILEGLDGLDRAQLVRKCFTVVEGNLESLNDFRFSASSPDPLRLIMAEDVPKVTVPAGSLISSVSFAVVVDSLPYRSLRGLNSLSG